MKLTKGRNAPSVAHAVFESMKTEVGSQYATRFQPGMGIDPSAYTTAYSFAKDYAICKFLSKYRKSSGSHDLRAKAVTAFKDAEARNFKTNVTIRSGALTGAAFFCLEEARRKIHDCLGTFNMKKFLAGCDWGPGATATIMAEDATVDQKILEPSLSVSRLALPYAKLFLSNDLNWLSARLAFEVSGPACLLDTEFFLLDSGRFTTVPKDWKSERGIDVQPTLNIFLQKGVGRLIRQSLKRVGVNLDDQSRNQMLASLAQRLGLATIDLAQASDSLCFELVKYLLPDTWFRVLRDLRTPSVTIEGSTVHLEKFSAMGNGYTFELESLIFWALAESLRKRFSLFDCPLGIYGDDIVIDARLSSALVALFGEVGFSVNVDKTFTEGLFYESCGKHYFNGIDVTPPYQKEEIVDLPSSIRCANRVFRWALRIGGGKVLDPCGLQSWRTAVNASHGFHDEINIRRWTYWVEVKSCFGQEPSSIPFPYIPWWLGDDFGLLSPFHFPSRNGVISFDRLMFPPRVIEGDAWALLANYLRRDVSSPRATYGLVSPRGSTKFLFGRGKTTPIGESGWPGIWPSNLS